MDKAIVTVLLIICGIVATIAMFNGVMPAISQSQGTISNAAAAASDRIGSRVEIIQVSLHQNQVELWVKNIGTVSIPEIQLSNVFLGSGSTQALVNYGGTATPYWGYQIIGSDTVWNEMDTIQVSVTLATPLAPGSYSVEFVTPNGVNDQVTFSA